MRYALTLLLLAACSKDSPSGPKAGLDPTTLVTNHLTGTDGAAHGDTAYVTWRDQSGQTVVDRVPPLATMCLHFTATTQTDSVQVTIAYGAILDDAGFVPGDQSTYPPQGSGSWAMAGPSIWMVPGAHENWTGAVRDGNILLIEVAQPPC